jgi:[ribosomal protein S18]-alanine N-acetyltransferase
VTRTAAEYRSGGSAGVVLREMRWWDIDRVLELERILFPEDAWSAGLFWSELAHTRGSGATRRYIVAEEQDAGRAAFGAPGAGERGAGDGRTLVAYGGLAAVGGTGDVQTIGVLPSHRGTGLGARLLGELLAAAAGFSCHEVLLEVRVDNAPAQRLYERFGFTRIGLRRGYYQPGNVDALVMRLETPAPSTNSQGTKTHG